MFSVCMYAINEAVFYEIISVIKSVNKLAMPVPFLLYSTDLVISVSIYRKHLLTDM